MTHDIRVITTDGTAHHYPHANEGFIMALIEFSTWARIERVGAKQPPLIERVADDK